MFATKPALRAHFAKYTRLAETSLASFAFSAVSKICVNLRNPWLPLCFCALCGGGVFSFGAERGPIRAFFVLNLVRLRRICILVIQICFGFRASYFGFTPLLLSFQSQEVQKNGSKSVHFC